MGCVYRVGILLHDRGDKRDAKTHLVPNLFLGVFLRSVAGFHVGLLLYILVFRVAVGVVGLYL